MKSLAIGLSTVAVVLAVFAFFAGQAKVDTHIYDVSRQGDVLSFSITCTNDDAEALGKECQAAVLRKCPQGGSATLEKHSGASDRPYWVELRATCLPDPAI